MVVYIANRIKRTRALEQNFGAIYMDTQIAHDPEDVRTCWRDNRVKDGRLYTVTNKSKSPKCEQKMSFYTLL